MKENFLQIAEYIEALEKRLAAVEIRLAAAESKLALTESKLAETRTKFAEMGQHVAELEARPVIDDSEIEMDWIDEPAQPEIPAEPPVTHNPSPVTHNPSPVTHNPSPVTHNPSPVTHNPVADLKHAISLGDRFLFQRELFAQNGELMQKTLEALNGMPNIDGALAYLDKHFNWDKESPTFALFLNALHRRFG